MHAGMAQQPALDERRFVRAGVVQHQVQVQPGRRSTLHRCQEMPEIDAAALPVHLANDRASPHIERGEQVRAAMADVIVRVALELARAHGQHGRRALKGLDGGFFISVQHERPVGQVEVQPTMSQTLSIKCGSVESLNVSLRWGASAKARHIREIAVWLMPNSLAKRRVLECVAPRGTLFKVVVITRSMCSSRMLRGTPEQCTVAICPPSSC